MTAGEPINIVEANDPSHVLIDSLLAKANIKIVADDGTVLVDPSANSGAGSVTSVNASQDLNGNSLIVDADGDTTLTADTDDQIDIEINGADDFQFTVNTFTALSGSTIATNTIAETTAASGVTIDGVLVKDAGIVGAVDLNGVKMIIDADADTSITADTDDQIDIEINGADDFQFTVNTFTALSGSTIATNTIAETTAASGVTIDGVLVKDAGIVGAVDLNGVKMIIDADADTSITADTDDQIDIEINGADDFQFTVNTFTALSGSTIATNTIAETTAASGVTIDGVLVKDAGIVGAVDLNGVKMIIDADADTSITADTDDQIDIEISGADDFRFTANTFTALSGSTIATNTIAETTAASGVTIDGALLKDGRSNLGRQVQALTATAAISIKSGLVTLAHATVVIAATLAAPVAGDELFIVNTSASGTAAHTVTLESGVTFDGTNDIATLNAPNESLHIVAVSATRWQIIVNNNSVGLSAA